MVHTHTVGLIGHTGNIGKQILKHLIKPYEDGKLNIIILHRAGSDLSSVPKGIETRQVDISKPVDVALLVGINTLVTAVAFEVMGNTVNLVDAFAKSPDAVTFIPSYYSAAWSEADIAIPQMAVVNQHFLPPIQKAKEAGVGVTIVHSGLFSEYLFVIPFVGASLKDNTIQANAAMLEKTFPIITHEYLGAGIAQLVTNPPETIKDKSYSFIEYQVKGQGLVEAFEAVNGSKPTIIDFTEKDYEEGLNNPMGPIGTLYKAHWSTGELVYPNETKPEGITSKSLVELAKIYK
ncbi:hypothetical protein BCR39DRAFT_599556 [Naematelia encephala]|uniref:NmrA-like domain-containing protein n=1 Tax=Naematelia encephala TaxID=71784 RepID=A0A1Y2AXG0_9TREE|nr:hypothetical protein BCR39DRAFT_599556 [Naematelia encephala]